MNERAQVERVLEIAAARISKCRETDLKNNGYCPEDQPVVAIRTALTALKCALFHSNDAKVTFFVSDAFVLLSSILPKRDDPLSVEGDR